MNERTQLITLNGDDMILEIVELPEPFPLDRVKVVTSDEWREMTKGFVT